MEVRRPLHPPVKYFEPQHRVIRLGRKPFLLVTRQGITGSDWSSSVEDWMDLTLEPFEPVFSLTTKGHYSGQPDRVGLETTAIVSSMETEPLERLRVSYDATFTVLGESIGPIRSDRAVFVRDGTTFAFDKGRSKSSQADIENLYSAEVDRASNEDYLRYLLPALKSIASGSDNSRKVWLRRFLKQCQDTEEKLQLQRLLSLPRTR